MKMKGLILLTFAFVLGVTGGYPDFFSKSKHFSEPAAEALHRFAFDIAFCVERYVGVGKNFVIAPASLYAALAALEPGMGGETWFEVRRALYHERLRRPHRDTNRLMQRLFRPRRRRHSYQAAVLARLYVDAQLNVTRRFEHSVHLNPILAMRRPRFAVAPERVRAEINDLVRKVTRGKVEELIARGSVNRNTKLYLAEAFSIKANWESAFNPSRTRMAPFNVKGGKQISVPTMFSENTRCYINELSNDQTETALLIIPFQGNELTATIVMPSVAGDFSDLDEHKDLGEVVAAALARLPRDKRDEVEYLDQCRVQMPKLELATDIKRMPEVLRNVGVRSMFRRSSANLTAMMEDFELGELGFEEAVHMARLTVDERGMEGSGASAIGAGLRSVPRNVVVSRPFILLIRHEMTGAVLMYAKVHNPLNS